MLAPALLQTSLVLWLAQQTLQGGVKPQSVSWGRVLPARGVGIGVKPGVAGALGALGNRYGNKAMKTGIGRYPGAQLGVGGYRALGLGSRAGLKPGGYGGQGAYGASMGTGMGLGAGLTNGLGLGLGQGGRHVYGAGHGALPGYGALAGIGYPGARPGIGLGYPTGQMAKEQKPGVSTADLGGPEMANLGLDVRDLKRENSRAFGPSFGPRTLGPEMPSMRRTDILGAKSLDPAVMASRIGPMIPFDKQSKGPKAGESYGPMVPERRDAPSHGGTLVAGGAGQQLPLVIDNARHLGPASSQVQRERDYDTQRQQNQRAKNCKTASDLLDALEINRHELLGSETQRSPGIVPQPHVGKDYTHHGSATPPPQGESTDRLSLQQGQATRTYLSAGADGKGVKDVVPRIRGTVAVENQSRGSPNQVQTLGGYRPAIPDASLGASLASSSVEGQKGVGFTADGHETKLLPNSAHDARKPKALSIPGQTGRNSQATRYVGGAGNYLGASLGTGGYGAGLGQGAYLGGAAGKLGAAAALGQGGYPQGYGDGATGYLGAMAGNGYGGDAGAKATGYGNGFSDGYGAGLGYPAELADGAEHKAGKKEALGTGGYAGQVQGAYGALGAGLESTGGKYGGGAAQVPYGNAPVIPTGLEGDGGYPYGAQQLGLGAEAAKTANKYGAGAGYGAQQTGYGAQLGATQDALGEQAGKYAGMNGGLGNGYKG